MDECLMHLRKMYAMKHSRFNLYSAILCFYSPPYTGLAEHTTSSALGFSEKGYIRGISERCKLRYIKCTVLK